VRAGKISHMSIFQQFMLERICGILEYGIKECRSYQ